MFEGKPTTQQKAERLARDWEEAIAKSPKVAPEVGPKHFLYYHALEVMAVLGRKINTSVMLAEPQRFIKELREHVTEHRSYEVYEVHWRMEGKMTFETGNGDAAAAEVRGILANDVRVYGPPGTVFSDKEVDILGCEKK